MESALADENLTRAIARESAEYFDRYAAPEQVANYVIDECRAIL